MAYLTSIEANEFISEIQKLDTKIDVYNDYVDVTNVQIHNHNSNVGFKEKKAKMKRKNSIKDDLKKQTINYKKQKRYNELLSNSHYNRCVADFRNNNYLSAGEEIGYLLNINNGNMKYVYGYNFNHTLSPLYINRNGKLDILKLSKINNYYLDNYKYDLFYYVTLTMPNIIIESNDIKEQVEATKKLLESSNTVINNINKKIQKDFRVTGIVKKWECTFKENPKTGKSEAHPHYHLLIAVENKSYYDRRLAKGNSSLRDVIMEYWIEKFVMKKFPGTEKRNAKACFNWKRANPKTIAVELAGYQAKGAKPDYLTNQTIFDFAYLLFHNKRILTFIGEFKIINQLLKLNKIDEMIENGENIDDIIHDLEDGIEAEQIYNESAEEREEKRLNRYKEEFTHYMGFRYFSGNKTNGYHYTCIKEIDDDFTLIKEANYPKP